MSVCLEEEGTSIAIIALLEAAPQGRVTGGTIGTDPPFNGGKAAGVDAGTVTVAAVTDGALNADGAIVGDTKGPRSSVELLVEATGITEQVLAGRTTTPAGGRGGSTIAASLWWKH